MQEKYVNNAHFCIQVRLLPALAFVLIIDVKNAFEKLLICDYYLKNMSIFYDPRSIILKLIGLADRIEGKEVEILYSPSQCVIVTKQQNTNCQKQIIRLMRQIRIS